MKKTILATFLVSTLLLGGCAQTTSGGLSGNRSQLMLVSEDEVNAQADKAYTEVLTDAKNRGVLNVNKKQYQRVNNIAKKLIKVAPEFRADCANWDWEVNVLTEDTVNAWCMAGGKIAVYTGIIESLNLTDDELAVVIGHEMAHALKEHTREQASQAMLKQGAMQIASIFGASNTAVSLGGILADVGLMLPFSREHEAEADAVGLELIYKAGYDVDAGANVWRKMQQLNANEPMEILSTHPSSSDRIANLEKMAQDLKTFGKVQG